MSPSAKVPIVAATLIVILLLSGAWLLQRQNSRNIVKSGHSELPAEETVPDVRRARRSTQTSAKTQTQARRTTTPDRDVTTGVKTLPALSPQSDIFPSLTGYVVDSFESWTTIPEGYRYSGVTLRDGALTLTDVAGTTSPRFGELVSPALPLTAPAMAAPVQNPRQLPENTNLELEFRLSEDGENWTPWVAAEKYSPPDGKRVVPTLQPSLSEREIKLHAASKSTTSTATRGPSIRYRINLYASGTDSPAVADVRIWKREH